MLVLLLRYLCLVRSTANETENHTSGTETAETNETERQPIFAYSDSTLRLASQIEARLNEVCQTNKFLWKELEYNSNAIKFCDLLVQKHKFKTSLNDLSGIETAEVLSNFENDIDASIKSVLNAFDETRDACLTQLMDDYYPFAYAFDKYKEAKILQIAKCDDFKRSSFATYGDIEKFKVFFKEHQFDYVIDCALLKFLVFDEIFALSKNVEYDINCLRGQLSNPSLEENLSTNFDDTSKENVSAISNLSLEGKLSTDFEKAEDDTLKDNESAISHPSLEEKLSTDFEKAEDDTLKDNESVTTKPSMKEPLITDFEKEGDDNLAENENTFSNPSIKEPSSTDIEDARDDTLKENESTLSNPSVEEPLTTNIDDASDDTLKDNESSKSNPPMKDPLSKDFENARDDNLAENENTFSNPSMGEPLITDFEKEGDDNSKDNESTMFNPSVEESLITEFEDARDDNSEDNEGSTSSSNNSWVYVK